MQPLRLELALLAFFLTKQNHYMPICTNIDSAVAVAAVINIVVVVVEVVETVAVVATDAAVVNFTSGSRLLLVRLLLFLLLFLW